MTTRRTLDGMDGGITKPSKITPYEGTSPKPPSTLSTTDRSDTPRLALTPEEAAAVIQADDLDVVVRLLAALVETIARRAAEIVTTADTPRGQSS